MKRALPVTTVLKTRSSRSHAQLEQLLEMVSQAEHSPATAKTSMFSNLATMLINQVLRSLRLSTTSALQAFTARILHLPRTNSRVQLALTTMKKGR